jgi:hypothetical protein
MKKSEPQNLTKTLWKISRHPLSAVVLGALSAAILEKLFTALGPKLGSFLHVWWVTVIGTIVVLISGSGLFLFKKTYQALYGLAEVGFALAVGWTSMMRVQTIGDGASWIALVAAAYLIVRGLSNYEEGRKKTPRIKNKF